MLVFMGVCTCFVQAGSVEENLKNFETYLHRQVVQESVKKARVPSTRFADGEKQAKFDRLLAKAEDIFNESDLVVHFDNYFGEKWALMERGELYTSKEQYFLSVLGHAMKQATPYADYLYLPQDERRAVAHTLFVLVVDGSDKVRYNKYRKALGYTQEWLKENPVEDWNTYVERCEFYMEALYQALEGFVKSYEKGIEPWREYLKENNWLALEMQYDYDYE